MTELELFEVFGKEATALITVVLIYVLFIKPKDKHITDLVDTNRKMVDENSKQLGHIAETMDKISGEMQTLSKNQNELKEGQNELWKEIVKIKTKAK